MSSFKTIEISDPQYEQGNLRFITVKTSNLRGRGDICLFVPQIENTKDLPIVILLHGVYGSAWIWSQKGGANDTASKMINEDTIRPMILAMPSDGLWGDGSAYLPHNGYDFEKWIAEDVPEAIRQSIPEASVKSPLFISGLSMGGFGALRIGTKYHEVFGGISAHSSITSLNQMNLFVEEDLSNFHQANEASEDVWKTIEIYQNSIPPLRFDCGQDDPLIEFNRILHNKMKESSVPHEFFVFPGSHEWSYWQEHLKDTLLFFNRLIKE